VTTAQILTGVGRDHPRYLRAHRRGPAAQLRPAAGTAAAGPDLGGDFMGLALANQRGFDIPARCPFFETLVQLIIGVLFVSIPATVTRSPSGTWCCPRSVWPPSWF
jgi:hypothetical protein